MKRIISVILAVLLLCACFPALAETWYCPQCGRKNNGNFCPVDGVPKPDLSKDDDDDADGQKGSVYTAYAYVTGTLNSRLATRTGPSTKYDEPGSFLSSGSKVTVLSKAYDSGNGIWWLQVEFSEGSARYRAYTGLKRFNGLNLSAIPEEEEIGSCKISRSLTGYYGPSKSYRKISRKIPAGVSCVIFGYDAQNDGDFVQIEFFDQGINKLRRAWVPVSAVKNCNLYGN